MRRTRWLRHLPGCLGGYDATRTHRPPGCKANLDQSWAVTKLSNFPFGMCDERP